MRCLRGHGIVFAFLGFTALLPDITEASSSPLGSSHSNVVLDLPPVRISYEELKDGGFTPDPSLRASYGNVLKNQVHTHRPFFKDVPIIFPDPKGYKISSIQRAYTDYRKVHISGRHDKGEDSLTIQKGISGDPETILASVQVHEYSRDALAARKTFGETAAIVAYGHRLSQATGEAGRGSMRKPPDWDQVWASPPAADDITVKDARDLLEQRRYLRFRTPEDRAALGIRLLPDGSLEQKWLTSLKPIFHL